MTIGSGTGHLDAGLDGRLAATTVITTTCGAALTFEAGAILRTPEGVHLIGGIAVTIRDFKAPKRLPGGVTAEAGVEILIALEMPSGPARKTPARIEPAALLDLPAVTANGPTYVTLVGASDDGFPWDGAGRPDRLAPHDEAGRTVGLTSDIAIGGSGPVLFDLDAAGGALGGARERELLAIPLAIAADSPARVERIPIPPGDSVEYVRVINTGTAQIVGSLNGYPGDGTSGIGLGESDTSSFGWTATVVEVDGQRYLEVSGEFANTITIQYRLTSQGTEGSDHRETRGGSGGGDEGDLDATYQGFVDITITGCPSSNEYADFEAAYGLIAALGIEVNVGGFASGAGGYAGTVTTNGYTGSVQGLAAQLPPDWVFTFGDRTLAIHIPCPPPLVFAASASDLTLRLLDPDLNPLIVDGLQPRPLIVIEPDARGAILGIDDSSHLVTIDPVTLSGTSTRIDATGVTSHPTLPIAIVTTPGRITAYGEFNLRRAWQIRIPGRPALTSPDTNGDGSLLFVRAPGAVIVVDVLRELVIMQLPVPGVGPLDVHRGLPMVAALDTAANQVWIAAIPGTPAPASAGTNPRDIQWLPDQPIVAVTSFGDNTVRFLPGTQQVPVANGPTAVATVGGGVAYVASRIAGQVQRLGGPPLQAHAYPGVNLVEVARRSAASGPRGR